MAGLGDGFWVRGNISTTAINTHTPTVHMCILLGVWTKGPVDEGRNADVRDKLEDAYEGAFTV